MTETKYQFQRYHPFYNGHILSFYDRAKDDQRYLAAPRALESKLDRRSRAVVEHPHRRLANLQR